LRVALVHDWLTGMRGGEKVLEEVCGFFPQADLFTLLHVPGSVSPAIENRRIFTSPLQKIPGIAKSYRRFLPLFPHLMERFDFSDYDFLLSTSSCVAKGARPARGARHVSYVFSPMRYVWDRFDDYFGPGQTNPPTRAMMRLLKQPLRRWDRESAHRVHAFIADSHFVAGRIRAYYNRDSAVIEPPVDVERFRPGLASPSDEWLVVSAFAPYKRIDVAIEAAEKAGVPLALVGQGPEEKRLRRIAGKNTRFLGWLSEEDLARALCRCRGLLFPGVEDFGITPVEAMACGRPVVALGEGGARETVVGGAWDGDPGGVERGATGLFVREQTPAAFARAIREIEAHSWDHFSAAARARSLEFRPEIFRERMRALLHKEMQTTHLAPADRAAFG
jgi:glycosyltransferase involved in cell wall biosynthesis